MNWDAIGAIGEVVGAAAVVISIVYLSVQIKQNTKATKLDAEREIALFFARSLQEGAGSEIPGAYIRGAHDPSELSEEEAARFGFWNLGFFRYLQYAYDQKLEGNLSDSTWESLDLAFRSQIQSPGIRKVWNARSYTFKPAFREYVESISTVESFLSPTAAVQEIISKKNERAI